MNKTKRTNINKNSYNFLTKEFSEFSKNTELGLCLINKNFEIIWANKRQTAWFGPLKNLRGKHCYETFERNPNICISCPVLETFRTGKPSHSEPRVAYTRNGKVKFYEISTSPIMGNSGSVEEVLEIVKDITARKLLEDEHRKLLTALDAAGDFILITDMKGKLLYVNGVFENKCGFNKKDLIGTNVKTLMRFPGARDFLREVLKNTLSKGEWVGIGWIVKSDSTKIRCNMSTSLVRDKHGRPIAIVGISRDVTKERQQEKELLIKSRRLNFLNKRLLENNKIIKDKAARLNDANDEIVLLNKSLEGKVEERTRELRLANEELLTLYALGKKMVSTLDPAEVLDIIVSTASAIIDFEAAAVSLLAADKKTFVITAHRGMSQNFLQRCRTMDVDGSDCRTLITLKTPLAVANLAETAELQHRDAYAAEGFKSMVSVPILFNEEILGIINIFSRKNRMFLDNEINLLQALASQAAIAIKNAYLHENVALNYYNTINTLSLAVEARDPYTRGHSERVTNYALGIGRTMGLSQEELSILKYSGKIHDIGKIGISDLILLKPGKLTPSEKAQIELHPIKGVEIIANLKFLEPGVPIIKHHHERYDGMGYPDGLRDKSIPLGARILSVADAFDAMTSERPYRGALAFEEAIEDLKRNSGKQFDPYIVSAFLQMIVDNLPK